MCGSPQMSVLMATSLILVFSYSTLIPLAASCLYMHVIDRLWPIPMLLELLLKMNLGLFLLIA